VTGTVDTALGAGPPHARFADHRLAECVDAALTEYLDRRGRDAEAIDTAFGEAAQVLAQFVRGGGKRIRPTFAWWGWRGAGGNPLDAEAPAVLRAVSALELVQASALIHDDLIDGSATRRGHPTVHVRFAGLVPAGLPGRAHGFGLGAAVLLGDLALAWADDMLRAAGLPAAAAARAVAPWEAMRTEVVGGQYLDLLNQTTGNPSPHAALIVDRFKTAAYTVERPLHLGAAIAGADPALVACYRRFGAALGVAFQLRDDLLGMYGDPSITGKPAGDDLREGKRTLLLAIGVQRAEERGASAARAALHDAVGDPELDAATLDRVRTLLSELGAVRTVEERIEELTVRALDALGDGEIAEPAASRLAELAATVTRRDR